MVLSKRVARFNRVATNRVAKHVVNRVPGFGTVVHRGRRSGKEYRTPVNLFRTREGIAIALTYGPDSDWVRNVVAAGEAEIETWRGKYRVQDPRVVHDETRRAMPPVVRQMLGLLDVHDFLLLKRE